MFISNQRGNIFKKKLKNPQMYIKHVYAFFSIVAFVLNLIYEPRNKLSDTFRTSLLPPLIPNLTYGTLDSDTKYVRYIPATLSLNSFPSNFVKGYFENANRMRHFQVENKRSSNSILSRKLSIIQSGLKLIMPAYIYKFNFSIFTRVI